MNNALQSQRIAMSMRMTTRRAEKWSVSKITVLMRIIHPYLLSAVLTPRMQQHVGMSLVTPKSQQHVDWPTWYLHPLEPPLKHVMYPHVASIQRERNVKLRKIRNEANLIGNRRGALMEMKKLKLNLSLYVQINLVSLSPTPNQAAAELHCTNGARAHGNNIGDYQTASCLV